MEPFYIINTIRKINRAHWNLPWMSCILKFRSLKISLEPSNALSTAERRQKFAAKHHGIYEIPPFGQAYCAYCVLSYEKKRPSTKLYMEESMRDGGDQALN